ncbi:immune inhibitor A [Phycicoccus endophyticus]|uniref:Immune inhibitor A n=1 Tax=Phycicoccus endophyticus TaxID=1690220 RepID=A0A7G9R425_9MICO|nr:immune inhibitor A domain-containing protein [Phycicoccus endophyticus]NHI18191.1 M6 family metalloprotease domain-containing protein [Phycicoccus endophyticus]QNN50350.1 immune inhibitor A [Phycicoccus endophyticus]GGL25752.1 protease [Phycicoccus endophyticus]
MKRRHVSVLSGVAAAAIAVTLAPATAQAVPAAPDAPEKGAARQDDLPNPLAEAQAELREDAIQQLVRGEAKTKMINGNRVIEVKSKRGDRNRKGKGDGRTKYVNYPVDREEDIFTILVDFGDQVNPATGGSAGPQHNQIPEPDRSMDNSTYWLPDFDREHYLDMMFGDGESFKDFYLKQSNGRFLATGDVSDWVQVPYNEARYGSNKYSDASTYWPFIRDTAAAWYEDQKAAGKSDAEIKDYLAQFDQVDRYDYDGDGNFNEPDGYIDHFQAIHAGEGEEAGGGAQGDDAIWSHRWYAYSTNVGVTGPDNNKLGGVPLGDTGLWIGDYTTEPENGGLGVFTHEFGHDLGLPDLYDTAGGDNGTGFWTLMSGGSWLNHGGDAIGTTPGYMGVWEKLQLGWLDPQVVPYGQNTTVKLGSADKVTRSEAQAVIVPLPERTVTTEHNTPHSGSGEWWTGYGNDLSATLAHDVDLTGASSAEVSAYVSGDIEVGYDYLYGEVSTDGGSTWTPVGDGIDGSVDGDEDSALDWTELSWDLSAYAGQDVKFRFRFATDGGVGSEAFIDDITTTVDGEATTDDVESGADGWSAAGGFQIINGTTTREVQDMYLAENRTYSGYDTTLKQGPYNFGWANTKPDWVERFPYQNGLLVWFANGEYDDNNTSVHPGAGQVLPVDARPNPVTFADGSFLGNRRQPFDATFGLERTDRVTFHKNGSPTTVPSSRGIPTFDDRNPERYWSSLNPWSSTKVAGSGTTMTVKQSKNRGRTLKVRVAFK